MNIIGITEQGDAAVDNSWKDWVYHKNLPAILITKNPVKLIVDNPYLFLKENRLGNAILHATITGMGNTWLEPGVPDSDYTLKRLKGLLDNGMIDSSRIVIRQDPIFVSYLINNGVAIKNKIFEIGRFAKEHNLRYRMSFLDLYPHVKERMKFTNPSMSDDILKYQPDMHLPLKTRLEFLEILKKETGLTDTDIEVCGEPDIKCTGCVSQKDLELFGIELPCDTTNGVQRPACACLGIKKELLSNKHRCSHQCLYCYWKD